ncbi:hypothetical protein THTE_4197 [Thermogutta terrifontis]|uniref:Uncharacterized protein n=1 Tax=Thermogutta terrifontis TaxID=1331910 RepID=A0A286RLG6_9BACT|nr:hypothetical protein THTE_4197 [Thermogutta terrifontis]
MVKALAFTTFAFAVFCREGENGSRVGTIHELPLQRRRDPLVGFGEHRWMTHSPTPGTTSVPLRVRRTP